VGEWIWLRKKRW